MAGRSGATLSLHSGETTEVTRATLLALPAPQSLGPRHKPLPFGEIVETMFETFPRFALVPKKEQYGLSKDGGNLFGIIQFQPRDGETALSLGFRSSTKQHMALRGGGGEWVFVCDNMNISGDEFVFAHKNTLFATLRTIIYAGMEQFLLTAKKFDAFKLQLQERSLTVEAAHTVFGKMLAEEVVPARYLGSAAKNYFKPEEMPDCAPRSMWGLNNALTRALRENSIASKLEHTTAVAKFLAAA